MKDRERSAEAARGLASAARSHPGRVRSHNEDTFVCRPERGLFAVVDGMGGEGAGEVAAAITREALLTAPDPVAPAAAFEAANRQIRRRAATHEAEARMGCVATAVRFGEGRLTGAHVGDTRAYLVSAHGCERLTRDHTLAAEYEERHALAAEEAEALPDRHRVTRDLGGAEHPDDSWIDRFDTELALGDLLLLCSDGLSDLLPEREICERLSAAHEEGADLERLVDRLVERALEQGGTDNVTAVAVRYEEPPPDEETVPLPAAGPPRAGRPRVPRTALLAAAALLLLLFGGIGGWLVRDALGPAVEAPRGGGGPGSSVATVLEGLRVEEAIPVSEDVEAPAEPWRWRVPAGETLAVRRGRLTAPGRTLEVELGGADSRLVFEDSTLDLGSLVARGPAGSRLELWGGSLRLRDHDGRPLLEGPDFERRAGTLGPSSEPTESPGDGPAGPAEEVPRETGESDEGDEGDESGAPAVPALPPTTAGTDAGDS